MTNFCKVPHCTSRSDIVDPDNPTVSFHYLPVSLRDRNRWIKIIKERCNYEVRKYFTICSLHFHDDCFNYDKKKNKRTLRQGAAPTLFPSSSHSKEYDVNFQEIWIENGESHYENKNDEVTLSDQNAIFFDTDDIIVETESQKPKKRKSKRQITAKSKKAKKVILPRDPFEEIEDRIETVTTTKRRRPIPVPPCENCEIRRDMQCDRSIQTDIIGSSLTNFLMNEDNVSELGKFDVEKTKITPSLRCQLQHEEILQYRKRIASLQTSRNQLMKRIRRLESKMVNEKFQNSVYLSLVKVDHNYSLPPTDLET